jgi:ribosomal protein S13
MFEKQPKIVTLDTIGNLCDDKKTKIKKSKSKKTKIETKVDSKVKDNIDEIILWL